MSSKPLAFRTTSNLTGAQKRKLRERLEAEARAQSMRQALAWGLSLLTAIAAIAFVLANAAAARGPVSVAPLAEELSDAVVNISTSKRPKGPGGVPLPRVPDGSPFEDLFKDFFNKEGKRQRPSGKVSSLGSGFVIDGKEGLIVTNNHVIEGADEINIIFPNGSKLRVEKVLGTDKKTDLALLKVSPKKELKAVKFGSSEKMRVGDWVLAIGNPFGLGGSVSVGIISAKQRDIQSGPYDDYLQTDAAINKGNSGGPLFNMDGDVIGVNTAIISPTGGSIGIGFAVPSDVATVVIDQLRRFGETRRGWLGVNIQSVGEDIAASFGVPPRQGALVSRIVKGGPAEAAGLKAGDVILKFDGKTVRSVRSLPRLVAQTGDGREVDVEISRKGQKQTLKVVIGRLQEKPTKKSGKSSNNSSDDNKKTAAMLGMTLSVLTPELRAKYKLSEKAKGVVITEVTKGTAAQRKELKPGNLIVEAAQTAVKAPGDVAKAVAKVRSAGRPAILLRIEAASGDLRFVAIPLK